MIPAIILLVTVIGTAAVVMVRAYLKQRIPWIPLPQRKSQRILYVASPTLDPVILSKRLDEALTLAAFVLAKYDVYSRATIEAALYDLRIFVVFTPTWENSAKIKVAGETRDPHTIYVGSDLKALCHELRHVVLWLEMGDPNENHLGWSNDAGFINAINEFEAEVVKL